MTAAPNATTHRWYHERWFVLGMLFLILGPFGLPLLWRSPRFSAGERWGFTALVVVYTLVLSYLAGWAVLNYLGPRFYGLIGRP